MKKEDILNLFSERPKEYIDRNKKVEIMTTD